jgi:hypothetical protein
MADRQERYIPAAVRASIAGDTAHGFNLNLSEPFVAPLYVLQALRSCDRFRTLDEHAQVLADAGYYEGAPSLARETLLTLRELKLLVSEQDVLGRERVGGKEKVPISAVYIPTRNRPEHASRCLASHAATAPRKREFRVVDDSDSEVSGYLPAFIARTADVYGVDVRFLGRAEKGRYLEKLRSSLGSDPELSSALDTVLVDPIGAVPRIGVNRNWVLLDSIGEVCASVDDDTRSASAARSDSAAGLAFSSEADPTVFELYQSMGELEEDIPVAYSDLVSEHERLVGRDPRTLAAGVHHFNPPGLDHVTLQFARRLMATDARVRLTAFGQAGDPGRVGFRFLLRYPYHEVADKLPDAASMERSLTAPHTVRHVLTPTIADAPFFMSTHFGFDNRDILPPVFPAGHNDDGVFAEMVLGLVPGAVIGHLPAGVRHEPGQKRRPKLGDVLSVTPSVSTFAGLAFHEFEPLGFGESAPDAIKRAGSMFVSIGGLSDADFAGFIRWHWRRFLGEELEAYTSALHRSGGAPEFWVSMVQKIIERIETQLASLEFPTPVELRPGRRHPDSIPILRKLFRDFGLVMLHWDRIRAAVQELRCAGIRASRPVQRAGHDSSGRQ